MSEQGKLSDKQEAETADRRLPHIFAGSRRRSAGPHEQAALRISNSQATWPTPSRLKWKKAGEITCPTPFRRP